jgi:DNA repair protein RadC
MKPNFNHKYKGMQCHIYLVKENENTERIRINSPADVYDLVKAEMAHADREMVVSIMLATNNHLIGVETVSIGTLNAAHVSPREIFKSAILANANGIIICHNHPTGELEPSHEDHRVTELIKEAGDLLGIKLIDHIIVSTRGFKSLKEDD